VERIKTIFWEAPTANSLQELEILNHGQLKKCNWVLNVREIHTVVAILPAAHTRACAKPFAIETQLCSDASHVSHQMGTFVSSRHPEHYDEMVLTRRRRLAFQQLAMHAGSNLLLWALV
jgi:hypothetical protein